jgi:hypothetical protein
MESCALAGLSVKRKGATERTFDVGVVSKRIGSSRERIRPVRNVNSIAGLIGRSFKIGLGGIKSRLDLVERGLRHFCLR